MRRLFYIPIISLYPNFDFPLSITEERIRYVVGRQRWQFHEKTVKSYWQTIREFWEKRKVDGFKIFAQFLVVGGKPGKQVVKEKAKQGQFFYQIIEKLLDRGARVVRTEKKALLLKEYYLASELLKNNSSLPSLVKYRLLKKGILQQRDNFIKEQINQSLKDEETGIGFFGPYHQILEKLPKDIRITKLKEPLEVRNYYQKLIFKKSEETKEEINKPAFYLIKPIKVYKEMVVI